MDNNNENDENQELVNEEEDDDFPEYANEANKELNEKIKLKRRIIRDINSKIEEKSDKLKVLSEHLKNIQQELLHTQALIDTKNKEIETEDHLKQITERQIGRLQNEMTKQQKIMIEQQERLNDVQNSIYRGNERLDKYKIEMNWNQEELEQWVLAARQKEEDSLTMEKYKRGDEAKIKELNLQIEKLTVEVSRRQNELDREITETQTAQIELDKTAEEFRRQHDERHKLFQQWQEVTDNIARRDQAIRDESERYADIKAQIKANQQDLENRKSQLMNEKQENKSVEVQNQQLERTIIQQRQSNKDIELAIDNLKADVEIQKNQLSAFATDLSNKRNRLAQMSQELLIKKQRLNNAQKKYASEKQKLKLEDIQHQEFEKQRSMASDRYKNLEKQRIDLDKEIKLQKEVLFKATQDLFKLRENEANLYGEIQANVSACRNYQAHINKLIQEFQRQQELLYNAEYQIQLMERRVARAKGERTLEEKKDLENEIKEIEEKVNLQKKEYKTLLQSLKRLDDDLRGTDRQLTGTKGSQTKLKQAIDELTLENDMTYQDLSKIVKSKEEVLVQHDFMKLEIQKIQKVVTTAVDKVFNLENRKYQLEMAMQEREQEIQVHKDVLVAEHKAAEEERHKIAVELAERQNRVKNLRIKYESLVQKNKSSNGEQDTQNIEEHSQAYYIIKASQEREELQRKGDELNAEIIKRDQELKALDNTLSHLKNRNSKYRDSFLNKGISQKEVSHRDGLEEQCRAASENLFKKKKELQRLQQEIDEDMRRLTEIQNRIEILDNQEREMEMQFQKLEKELQDQQEKINRAENIMSSKLAKVQQKRIVLDESNAHISALELDIQNNLNKTLKTCILQHFYSINLFSNLVQEFPEMQAIIDAVFQEKNVTVPSKQPSSVGVPSVRSSVRSASSQGRR
ncbi:unnamed protein product (macronuclear) [Paramecium tetraurelia]|uniref:Coiled-coil domain-containing protein 39 n=1 Tax=Paramecium tetraurelia TaxID=5888 RepID=A0BMJ8_PARTE|nr:uncharacterized protein GSPATT00030401001 [Paramecium tetraurelia]CAK59765.1 unnamed protein product [Paramecium tetraurelia]|eukprot:XP_001427163.1 hypothetical protein (macronuclear) [Paramecium tetraurelia strain d4-2]